MDSSGRRIYNPIIESTPTDPRKQKKLDKNAKKASQAYEAYLESIKNAKVRVPPARVKHDKTDASGKTKDIFIDNLMIIVGGKTLLEDSQLKMTFGRKYGLIGKNGIGKTCLMNALSLRELQGLPDYIQVLLVEQEIEGSDKTPLDLVLETDGERTDLMLEQERLSESNEKDAAEKINAIYQRLEQIQASSAEARAQKILHGLGFSEELMNRKSKHLSGGWRMRISLARALFVQPDILLLDEPTNHLDLEAVIWLQDYCLQCEHTVVVVSHDREFLNVVCDEMIHFYDQKLTYYSGNYDQYEKTRSEKLTNQKKQYDKQQIEIAHMQSFVDRFRANNARASQAQSRVKALQKMELIDEVLDDPTCVFYFNQPDKIQNPLLRIEDGVFYYNEETPILENINFNVEMDSRIALLGANGAGKSTLLGLLVEKIKLIDGNFYRNQKLRISLFTQHHMEQLNLMLNPVEQLNESFPGSKQETYRAHLSKFGLIGEIQLQPQYLLSGGQKSRVSFAMAVWNNPHILIMDEPTNHLDIDAVNALIVALNDFQGALIIVSHDQYFVSTVCNEIFYIKDYNLNKFDGGFQDYVDALIDEKL